MQIPVPAILLLSEHGQLRPCSLFLFQRCCPVSVREVRRKPCAAGVLLFRKRYFDQTDIFLRAEDVESFLGEFWSHDDFEENRLHSFSGFLVAFTVHGNDAAESRFAVSVEGSLECFKSCAPKSGAAWVRVLDDDACRWSFHSQARSHAASISTILL